MEGKPTKRVLLGPIRERLVENLDNLQANNTYPPNTHFVIKHQSEDLYLRRLAYTTMKEEEKWKPLEWADRFLSSDAAGKFAKRMLGHNNFKIVPKLEDDKDDRTARTKIPRDRS